MASAAMQTHHQLDANRQSASRPDRSDLSMELSVSCAPSGYLQHHQHTNTSSQVHHEQEHSNQTHYASASQFYPQPTEHSSARANQRHANQLQQSTGEQQQFYYQQQQTQVGGTSDISVYQQLYGGSNQMGHPGEMGLALGGLSPGNNTNYTGSTHHQHQYELTTNATQLSSDCPSSHHHHAPGAYPQSFIQPYLGYSGYAANQSPSVGQPNGDNRRLSADANQSRAPIDGNRSVGQAIKLDEDLAEEQCAKQHRQSTATETGQVNLQAKLAASHILHELETSANKRCREKRSIGCNAEEINQFQEVASKKQRIKKQANKYAAIKTTTTTTTGNLSCNQHLDEELDANNYQLRDFSALNAGQQRRITIYDNRLQQIATEEVHFEGVSRTEDTAANSHQSHPQWSVGNNRHYNQLGADLDQQDELQVNKTKSVATLAHNTVGLDWFQHEPEGRSGEADISARLAGGLQENNPNQPYLPRSSHFQKQQPGATSYEHRQQQRPHQPLEHQNAGGKVRGGGTLAFSAEEVDGASELEVEELEVAGGSVLGGQFEISKRTNGNAEQNNSSCSNDYNQLRVLEMRKEKSRDAARSRRSKENHEFYELAKLLPLPAAITSQLDFLDKASIIRLTISFLKLRQFSVNGHPPWAPDFTTLASINPYSSQSLGSYAEHYPTASGQVDPSATFATQADYLAAAANQQQHIGEHQPTCLAQSSEKTSTVSPSKTAATIFDIHQGTHILQSLDGFAFAIGRDGRFLYISETVSMYLGLSQVEMTGSSVFDYTHQQDHDELARQLGIVVTSNSSAYNLPKGDLSTAPTTANHHLQAGSCDSPTAPNSVHSQYSIASNETMIEDYVNHTNACSRSSGNKRAKVQRANHNNLSVSARSKRQGAKGGSTALPAGAPIASVKVEHNSAQSPVGNNHLESSINETTTSTHLLRAKQEGTQDDPLVRQFCIRMKSTLTKRGCQHFKSSGYRVVHVVAHLRSYQSNDHGHLMDPLDELGSATNEAVNCATSNTATPADGGAGKVKRAGRQAKSAPANKPLEAGKSTPSSSSSSINEVGQQVTTHSDTSSGESRSAAIVSEIHHQVNPVRGNRHQTTRLETMNGANNEQEKIIGMVAVAIALPPPSINELRLESGTFVLRLNLELRVTHIEPKITELLHYPVELIAGRSLYSLVHPADVQQVQKCHQDLLRKGQMMSGYYRLLARNGGYIWIQSCATMICNNTYNATAAAASAATSSGQQQALAILPANLAASPGGAMQTQANQQVNCTMTTLGNHQIQPATLVNVYNLDPASGQQANYASSGKLASPGLSSSFDNQDQDQCVIFVNYMVTNIVGESEIMDICQSPNYAPSLLGSSSFSTGTTSTTTNDTSATSNLFNSPSSSCSSPCVGSLRAPANNGANNHHQVTGQDSGSVNLSSPRRHTNTNTNNNNHQHHHHHNHNQHYQQVEGKRDHQIKSANNRRTVQKSKLQYLASATPIIGDENGHDQQHLAGHFGSQAPEQQQQHHVKLNPSGHFELGRSPAATGASYGYGQTPGSVNLALSKVSSDPSWLAHQQAAAGGRLLADPVAAVYGQHAAEANQQQQYQYAAYKAAFNLTDYNQQQQQQQHNQVAGGYSSAGNVAAAVYPSATGVSANSWETAATVAAVAAASANHHLSSHHHQTHNVAANPYTHHLEHSHHSHHHHNPANSYYNYYGYGNKFI